MTENPERHKVGEPGTPPTKYQELFDQAQDEQLETEAPSPERQRPSHESLSVTYLNTSFSEAFDYPEGLDSLLLRDGKPRENAVFGFSEVTAAQRPKVKAELEARGYRVVEPQRIASLI